MLNAQSEQIRLIQTKTTWTENFKATSISYNYHFSVGDGPVIEVSKNGTNLAKYITDRRAESKFDEAMKKAKIGNIGAYLI